MPEKDYITLQGLRMKCIIGIFDWERKRKQEVLLDLRFPCDARRAARRDDIRHTVDYKAIAKASIAFVEQSCFQLVETLAERLAALLLGRFGLGEVWISVQKPGAVRGSRTVGVELHRAQAPSAGGGVVFSLGSNIEPAKHLSFALGELDARFGLTAVSRVYETSPVGLKEQPPFWNLAAAVETREAPARLKAWLRTLEKKAGRRRGADPNGPRTLDVDLILWNGKKGPSLPHPDIPRKAFVLVPLAEILPTALHPTLGRGYLELAADFRDPRQKVRLLPPDVLG